MAHSNTWDSTFNGSPSGSTKISVADEAIQTTREAIQERIALEHYFDTGGTDARHGEHKKGSARAYYQDESTSDPTTRPDGSTNLTAATDQGRLMVIDDDSGDSDRYYLKAYSDSDTDKWQWIRGYNSADTDDDETVTGTWTFSTAPSVPTDDPSGEGEVSSVAHVTSNRQAMVGMIAAFGCTPPADKYAAWVLCDGSAVTAAEYPELHALLTTSQPFGGTEAAPNVPDIPSGAFLMSDNDSTGDDPATTLTSGGDVAESVGDHDHGAGPGDTGMALSTLDVSGTTDSGTASIGNESSHYHYMWNGNQSSRELTGGTGNDYPYSSTDGEGGSGDDEYYICCNNTTPDLGKTGAGSTHTHTDSGHTHTLTATGTGSHRHTLATTYADGSASAVNAPKHVTVYWYIFAGKDLT